MNSIDYSKENIRFKCAHEVIPAAPKQTETLFAYARWLETNNLLKQDEATYLEIERLYRIAAESGHFKASKNLQNGSMRKRFHLKGYEHLRLSQQMIETKVATGYLLVGYYLQQGSAGLKQDSEMALRYYQKAADLGNAEAQAYLADKLAPINVAPEIALQLRRCAAEQGHGKTANLLGVHFAVVGRYQEALEAYQLGVAAGDDGSAGLLSGGFSGVGSEDLLYYIAQPADPERAARYKKIWKLLSGYSYANPKVPEINDIVPLPPAPLPEWDGTLKWVEARKANIPPEKPSEALINELAKEKVLDPATGKPLPGSPVFHTANIPVLTCYSEQPCPKAGYWMMTKYFSPSGGNARYTQYFEEGQIMPLAMVTYTRPRLWPLSDKVTTFPSGVFWGMFDGP